MQGQGSAVKVWRALPLGATLYLLENARAGQCSKRLASAAWGATPLSLGKMQGQGSAATIGERCWGGYPSILQEQGSAVKIWRALPLGRDPCIFRKNMGALIPTKTP